MASRKSQDLSQCISHTVPHPPLEHTSTRPSSDELLPANLTEFSTHNWEEPSNYCDSKLNCYDYNIYCIETLVYETS